MKSLREIESDIGAEKEWRNIERLWAHGLLQLLTIYDKSMLAERLARDKHQDDIACGLVVRYEDGSGAMDVVHGNPLSAEVAVRGSTIAEIERRFHPNGWPKEHPDSPRGRLLGPRGGTS